MSNSPGPVGSSEGSKTDDAKEQGKHVAEQARHEAGAVADKAREEVSSVAEVAQQQVRSLFDDARDVVNREAQQQVDRLAGALQGLGKNLQALQEGRAEEAGPLADYLERAKDELERVGDRVDELGLSGVLDETRRYARRRPGMFLGSAALAGLVVGRLARSGRDAERTDQNSGGDARRALPEEAGQARIVPPPSPAQTTGVGGPVDAGAGTVSTPGARAGQSPPGVKPLDEHGTVHSGVESER